MSTGDPSPPPPAPPVAPVPLKAAPASQPGLPREIRIVSHSNLFYWWPVWAVGYLMAFITAISGQVLATVPQGSSVVAEIEYKGKPHAAVIFPDKTTPLLDRHKKDIVQPHLHVSSNKNLGVLFCVVLLLVIFITNVPLRGLWSVIVIVLILSLVIIFAILGWWEGILETLSFLDIRINLGGYLLVSTVLLVFWLFVFFFFDRQIYMVFTPGQLRVRMEIGDAETAYDTSGMTIQKQRSDLFRHWILGMGSGDLIVKTGGNQVHHFDMVNVLFLGRKVQEIEDMLRSRQVVSN
jgi:hypothetical protein